MQLQQMYACKFNVHIICVHAYAPAYGSGFNKRKDLENAGILAHNN